VSDDLARGERFTRLLLKHQQRLLGFIVTLVPDWNDADDILQETASVMWRRFDEFDEGTNFGAWAMTIARYQVLDHRKRFARRRRGFSDESVELLADDLEADAEAEDARHEALQHCLTKLTPRDRELIDLRYEQGATAQVVADRVGRSADAVYKALRRIHAALLDCIERALRGESGS